MNWSGMQTEHGFYSNTYTVCVCLSLTYLKCMWRKTSQYLFFLPALPDMLFSVLVSVYVFLYIHMSHVKKQQKQTSMSFNGILCDRPSAALL